MEFDQIIEKSKKIGSLEAQKKILDWIDAKIENCSLEVILAFKELANYMKTL